MTRTIYVWVVEPEDNHKMILLAEAMNSTGAIERILQRFRPMLSQERLASMEAYLHQTEPQELDFSGEVGVVDVFSLHLQ